MVLLCCEPEGGGVTGTIDGLFLSCLFFRCFCERLGGVIVLYVPGTVRGFCLFFLFQARCSARKFVPGLNCDFNQGLFSAFRTRWSELELTGQTVFLLYVTIEIQTVVKQRERSEDQRSHGQPVRRRSCSLCPTDVPFSAPVIKYFHHEISETRMNYSERSPSNPAAVSSSVQWGLDSDAEKAELLFKSSKIKAFGPAVATLHLKRHFLFFISTKSSLTC